MALNFTTLNDPRHSLTVANELSATAFVFLIHAPRSQVGTARLGSLVDMFSLMLA